MENTDKKIKIDELAMDMSGNGVVDLVAKDTTGDGNLDTVMMDTTGDGETDTILIDVDGDGTADAEIYYFKDDEEDLTAEELEALLAAENEQ